MFLVEANSLSNSVLSFSLTARSPVLAKIIETDMLESVTGQLILKDIGAKAMDFLLKFLYSGTLKSVVGLGNEAICELINAATKVRIKQFSCVMNVENELFIAY
jgi:hypothetical protein